MPLSSKMTEYADKRVWNIEGHEITYLHIDYRFTFECWWYGDNQENNQLTVTIANIFALQFDDRIVVCDPEDPQSVKEAVVILHKHVSTLTAYRDGRLLVTFSDRTELQVSKSYKYESWEAKGHEELADLALLCSPHKGPPWKE